MKTNDDKIGNQKFLIQTLKLMYKYVNLPCNMKSNSLYEKNLI